MTQTPDIRHVYDISVVLGEESIDYPGDTPYFRELMWTIKDTGICDLSKLTLNAHSRTHVDSAAHFIPGGKTIDQYSATNFVLPAHVVEIEDNEAIRPCELQDVRIERGDALLFRTKNSLGGLCRSGKFSEEFVYLSLEAAGLCIEKEVALVGIDYITIERYGNNEFPVHQKLLGNNSLILEGVDLSEVPPGRYTLIWAPLKIRGCEASPVRAILLC